VRHPVQGEKPWRGIKARRQMLQRLNRIDTTINSQRSGGKWNARVRVAEEKLHVAEWEKKDFERKLRFQTAIQFAKAWIAEKRVETLEKLVDAEKKILDVNESRYKLGDISGVEFHLLQVDYLQTKLQLESAKKEEETNFAQLSPWLGVPLNPSVVLKMESQSLETVQDLPSLYKQAIANRADLAEAREKVLEAQEENALAKANAWPNVEVGAGVVWDTLFLGSEDISPTGILSSIQDKETNAEVRIRIPLPFFNRNQGEIEKFKKLHEVALLEEQNLRLHIESDVKSAWQSLQIDAKTTHQYETILLPAMKKNFRAIEEAYQIGGESVLAVLAAQKDLLQAEEGYLQSLFQLEADVAELKKAVGEGLP